MKVVTGLITFILAVLFLVSCEGESTSPTYSYQANFDPAMVDGVEEFMKDVAKRWELRLYEKSREGMKVLTHGQEAFFIALFLKSDPKNNWILDISNLGVGIILTFALYEHEDMPLAELQRLDGEVRRGLKEKFGIELLPYTEPYDRKDATERKSGEDAGEAPGQGNRRL